MDLAAVWVTTNATGPIMPIAHCLISSALLAGLLTGSAAHAALLQYTSLAAFNAATTGNTVESYSAPANSYTFIGNSSYNDVSYSSYAYLVDPGYAPTLYDWQSGAVLLLDNAATLGFAPITAFAADFGTIAPEGNAVTVTINGIATVIATNARPNWRFYGWTSTDPITSIQISTGGNYVVLDNVTRARAIAGPPPVGVPEPAPYALLGIGIALLALRQRR